MASSLFVLSIYQCANIVAPVGGPKDETPPMLDTAETTPNYQINYTKSPIILTFNEWIALKDAITQIVVSPPLQYPLDVKLKKKSVYVNFNEKEELKENTTYTINFGESISDFTEGNVPPNMRYVFATGPIIDSLKFKAKLVDMDSKEPIDDALLMLYINKADSVLYKSRPYYFAKTDTSGTAIIENIRADTFKVVALKDENLNYQLDSETELVSYLLDPIQVEGDTDLGILEMYTPFQSLVRRQIRSEYGKTTIYFNREPFDIEYDIIGDAPKIDYQNVAGDSLMLWYSDTTRGEWSFVHRNDTSQIDTIRIKKKEYAKGPLTGPFDVESKKRKISFKSDSTLSFKWNRPLKSIHEEHLILAKDSLSNVIDVDYSIDSTDGYLMKATGLKWDPEASYFWNVSQGAVTDIFDVQNDSIGQIEVKLIDPKKLGTVEITFAQTKREIMLDSDQQVVKVELLEPGTYTIRLIEDDNKNGRWDTGDYSQQTVPERIFIKVMPPLKANWEQTIDFKL